MANARNRALAKTGWLEVRASAGALGVSAAGAGPPPASYGNAPGIYHPGLTAQFSYLACPGSPRSCEGISPRYLQRVFGMGF